MAITLTARPADRLSAQVSVHLSAGARYTTTLVSDSIITKFSVRPAIAPALALNDGHVDGRSHPRLVAR